MILDIPNKNALITSLILLFMFPAPSISQEINRLDGSCIEATDLNQKVQSLMNKAQVTGLNMAIFNNDTTVYQRAFGYADITTKEPLSIDHIFYGASLSKAVFGYLCAMLIHQHKLDLDRPLNDYFNYELPDLATRKKHLSLQDLEEDIRYKRITARMCLSHTSGLPNWRWINNPDRKLRIHNDPGSWYSYSGEGLMLLQWIIEELEQTDFEIMAREMVFEPLGLVNTDYIWQERFENQFCYGHTSDQSRLDKDVEREVASAAGSMETNLVDYSKFLSHILKLNRQQSPITNLLFESNIRIKSKAQFGPLSQVVTDENDSIALGYGLGWGILDSPYGKGVFKEGHGEGFQHYSILFPDKGIGVLIMSNSDNAESIFKALLELTIADTYTPWKWENYIPFDQSK